MAEHKAESAAQSREEWLASLQDRGVDVSPEEMELLNSESPISSLLAQTLEVNANYLKHAGVRSGEIQLEDSTLTEREKELSATYKKLRRQTRDPQFLVESSGLLLENATSLTAVTSQRESLKKEAEGIVINAQNAFPTLRALIVEIAKADPNFLNGERVELQEADLDGFSSLLATARELLPGVVAQEDHAQIREMPQKERRKVEMEETSERQQENLFKNWIDVFGEEEFKRNQAENPNFLQMYKNAIRRIYDNYPEMFEGCGNPNVPGDFDWLRAIEPVLELSVAELNQAVNFKDSRTVNTTARILALAKRFMDDNGSYTHHDELTQLAEEVRAKGTEDNTILIDLFKTSEGMKEERVVETEAVTVYQAPETAKEKKKKDKKDEIEKITNSVLSILEKIHAQETAEMRFGFPKKTVDQPQIAKFVRAGTNAITSDFIGRMFDYELQSPHGKFSSSNHPKYTECDVVQLYMLRNINPRGKNKRLEKLMRVVEEVYPEARRRFNEILKAQEKDG